MVNSKKQMFIIIGAFIITLLLGTTTYAFFNYTRTGSANRIKTGRIAFNSEQGTAINLTNMFPIDVSEGIPNDNTKVGTLTINVTGDTTYTEGIEYLVTAVDVSNTVGSGNNAKSLPICINVTTSNLGTEDEEYFDHVDNANSHMYRVLAKDVIEDNGRIAVGYIKSGATGVNGTLTIKAYLDKAKVVISDTYPAESTDSNNDGYIDGTPTSFGEGKTVFTTEEWNSLQANGVSFKVKVEANEGAWVEEIRSVNAMNTFPTTITDEKDNIKEVYFNKMGATAMQNAYDAATIKADLTYNDEGKVLAWLETNTTDNTKYNLIVASDGDTYLPSNCSELFKNWSNTDKIEFNNVNTSRLVYMSALFYGCSSLTSLDLSSFDVSNINSFGQAFNQSGITYLNLDNWNVPNNLGGLLTGANSLTTISCRNWIIPSSFQSIFYRYAGGSSITTIDVTDWDLSNTTNIFGLFGSGASLTTLTGIETWDLSNVTTLDGIFSGCSGLSNKTLNARTQADADKLNNSSDLPSGLTFVVS